MSKYKEIVDELQKQIDADTREAVKTYGEPPIMTLLGDLESPFLRALRRKCEKLGMEINTETGRGWPTVADRETWTGKQYDYRLDIDEDAFMPSVAETVAMVVRCAELKQKDICIVGRGPAVQGLDKWWLKQDHTVTVCHSKTGFNAMAEHLDRAEIVVLGTPELPAGMTFSGAELIIDIGGAVDSAFAEACQNYLGPRDIGRLCTSILCNRAARWYL